MKSVFMQLEDIDAEVAQAKALLCAVQTCVEANLYDCGTGAIESVVRYHAGNIQVLLSVIGAKLDSAGAKLTEMGTMLHSPCGEMGGAA